MSLRSYTIQGDLGDALQCIKFEIKRHIRESKYTYFWIKINPPGTEEIYTCDGLSECCAADYCFEYIKNGLFSFDMKMKFPNKEETVVSVTKHFGEMTNKGPWDYSSTESECVVLSHYPF
ncbi:hypothetical protein DSO57_1016309 [Entomophthora muscae]|uniref:Uncharacterized protein n=1 Tax=Entomophthora muscae TaxID=34485 RepID=A0ACC2SU06_9FUNG|nr:hypothetical protein DSO57_1016309 [Entomophthora muscae]